MRDPTTFEGFFGKRFLFFVVFLGISMVFAGGTLWVLNFIYEQSREVPSVASDANELSLLYVNYNPQPDNYISAASYLAMGDYQRANPETKNVQVLTGLTTAQITNYMVNYFSAGMGVDCTYCHSLANFSLDTWEDQAAMERKVKARNMLLMTRDLNTQWLTQLASLDPQKKPSGAQIICATCHLGVAKPITWPKGQATLPDNLRLPYTPVSRDAVDVLNVNARKDISLDTVTWQQNIMYHMNLSLNVGCTHCHNSRYFPSWDVPAKAYALHMVQMSQFIWEKYKPILGEQEPSCLMCHHEAVIPPGAARSADVLPAALVPPKSTAQAAN